MKIIVLGAGVTGVTTAWFLSRDGHEVEVIDRYAGSGLGTSYANAGQVSPGYAAPWATPRIPMKILCWLFQRHAPLVLHPRTDSETLSWAMQFLKNCTHAAYAQNKSRMIRVAQYSTKVLRSLREEASLSYDQQTRGTLQLFRSQRQMDCIARDLAILERYGMSYNVLDRQGCVEAEPALDRVRDRIVGGLRLSGDETGDCFKFTQDLSDLAAQAGVTFRYGVDMRSLALSGGRVTSVQTSEGSLEADAFVLALGCASPTLAQSVGIRLPIIPIKGYSITFPIKEEAAAPRSTIMDESYKVAVTRLGDRVRVAGIAELAGHDLTLSPRRVETIRHVVRSLFPDAGPFEQADAWCGLRPATPDGTPVIGGCRYPNLWLNTGHGTLGWTMACGSAKVVADLIKGNTPDIDVEGLSVARYGQPDEAV